MTTATNNKEITDSVTAIAAFASHTRNVTVSGPEYANGHRVYTANVDGMPLMYVGVYEVPKGKHPYGRGINGTLYLMETDDGKMHVAIIARNLHDIRGVDWTEPIHFEEMVKNNA